jgi:alpha-N-arabinofuranosidase
MRIRNGRRKPFNIKVWCLGNEMDGDWQIGHKSAREYGRLAAETSKLLKLIDPTAETVVCGSSSREMATYKEWEREVLDLCYDTVDYLSLHQYYEPLSVSGDVRSYLSLAERMNSFICEVTQICDEVGKKKHSDKKTDFRSMNGMRGTALPNKENGRKSVANRPSAVGERL